MIIICLPVAVTTVISSLNLEEISGGDSNALLSEDNAKTKAASEFRTILRVGARPAFRKRMKQVMSNKLHGKV